MIDPGVAVEFAAALVPPLLKSRWRTLTALRHPDFIAAGSPGRPTHP